MSDSLSVDYVSGQAQVTIGDRSFTVDRRDNDARTLSCPVQLVSAALGS